MKSKAEFLLRHTVEEQEGACGRQVELDQLPLDRTNDLCQSLDFSRSACKDLWEKPQ
jgi:hypothetical protein